MRSLGLLALVTITACFPSNDPTSSGVDAAGQDAPSTTIDAAPPSGPTFQRCVGRAFTPPPAGDWATLGGQLAAAAGAPSHYVTDEMTPPASSPHLTARFIYGSIRKDLEDEPVEVFVDDCAGWQSLGQHVTDGDGAVDVAITLPLGPGVYEARFAVVGDATVATGYLWLLPAGTRLAVTDIDGTLTTSDTELFQQLLDGSYVPDAYPDAVALTDAEAARGHLLVYLTGRPYWLTNRTRGWLAELGFAHGAVHLAASNLDILPTDGSVGEYKRAYLASLIAKGYTLDLAYGNATTDIYAYLGAGVTGDRQWIIGTNGGNDGTHAVADSWTPRTAEVAQSPTIAQPFAF